MLNLDTIHRCDDPGLVRPFVAMIKQGEVLLTRKEGKDPLPLRFGRAMMRAQWNVVNFDPVTLGHLYFWIFKCRLKYDDCPEMVLPDPALELRFPGLAGTVNFSFLNGTEVALDFVIPQKVKS
jgi:hypothetical protein